ncbi:hypothetical protein K443DRAFT_5966 [Laccaria amethystina LaAM-08-1]|uniref:Uncharacterized protein n=1 Tax=Laccaria amethystina LaAM-08-1 TaxID=1095629 RepID=A0A0C9XMC2_9AGAR|nr:hypothetical protein K443DRAFT_5966 [Laccaria amethystina LaAM-08-1]
MPTQKQLLQDCLHDAIGKKAAARSKIPPTTLKAKALSGKENHATKAVKSNKKKAVKKAPVIQWAKLKNHPLTDRLLTIIEEKPRYRQAFGFSKEPGTNVTTGGQTLVDLYTKVADELLVLEKSSNFTADDLPELQKVDLGQTGQGLVDSETTDEIEAGTHLANVCDHIKIKFPWYKHLNKLFGLNPTIDCAAITNSQTAVNTSILDAPSKKQNKNRSSQARPPFADGSASDSEPESGPDNCIPWSDSDADGGGGRGDAGDGGGDGGDGDNLGSDHNGSANDSDNDDGDDSDSNHGDDKSNGAACQKSSAPPPAVHKPGRTPA